MGPSASILLRHVLTEHQIDEFERWLASITIHLEGVRGDWEPLWLKDGRFIDMPELEPGKTCAFGVAIEPCWGDEDLFEDGSLRPGALEEQDQLLKLLGYIPEQRISLWTGCNGKQDHQILGRLILLIAGDYQGLIDLGGAFSPPIESPFHLESVSIEEVKNHVLSKRESVSVEDVENYIASLSFPGQIFHIYYTTGRKTRWLWHIMDVDFFRAWLHHPRFRLIK